LLAYRQRVKDHVCTLADESLLNGRHAISSSEATQNIEEHYQSTRYMKLVPRNGLVRVERLGYLRIVSRAVHFFTDGKIGIPVLRCQRLACGAGYGKLEQGGAQQGENGFPLP